MENSGAMLQLPADSTVAASWTFAGARRARRRAALARDRSRLVELQNQVDALTATSKPPPGLDPSADLLDGISGTALLARMDGMEAAIRLRLDDLEAKCEQRLSTIESSFSHLASAMCGSSSEFMVKLEAHMSLLEKVFVLIDFDKLADVADRAFKLKDPTGLGVIGSLDEYVSEDVGVVSVPEVGEAVSCSQALGSENSAGNEIQGPLPDVRRKPSADRARDDPAVSGECTLVDVGDRISKMAFRSMGCPRELSTIPAFDALVDRAGVAEVVSRMRRGRRHPEKEVARLSDIVAERFAFFVAHGLPEESDLSSLSDGEGDSEVGFDAATNSDHGHVSGPCP